MAEGTKRVQSIDDQRKFIRNVEEKYNSLNQRTAMLGKQLVELSGRIGSLSAKINDNEVSRQALKTEKKQLKEKEKARKTKKSENKSKRNKLQASEKKDKNNLKKFNNEFKKEIESLEKKKKNSLSGKESFSEIDKKRLEGLIENREEISTRINQRKKDIDQLNQKIDGSRKEKEENISRIKIIDAEKKKLKKNNVEHGSSKKSLEGTITSIKQNQSNNFKDIQGITSLLKQERISLQTREKRALREQSMKAQKETRAKDRLRQEHIKRKEKENKQQEIIAAKAKKLGISPIADDQAEAYKKDYERLLNQQKAEKQQEAQKKIRQEEIKRQARIQKNAQQREQKELRQKLANVRGIQAKLQGNEPKYKDPELVALDKRLQILSPDATPNVRNNSGGRGRG